MTLDEPSTINKWIAQSGDIHLRHTEERKPMRIEGAWLVWLIGWMIVSLPWLYLAWWFVHH